MKMLAAVLAPILMVVAESQAAVAGPRVVKTRFATEDVVIATAVATKDPFGAKGDGKTDCTGAVQAAIDAVAKAGGGVVFLPEGRYRFEGGLLLRETVTLRGDWRSPEKDRKVEGTILMPTAGRGKAEDPPFVTMERGSGIRNLSVWYPDQDPGNIIPYPWTFRTSAQKTGNNTTVYHVTLVNSYQAIRFGSEWNELHTVRDVHGSPLACGIWMNFCTDIGRLVHVRFDPAYWLESGLMEVSDAKEKAVRSFVRKNGTGIFVERSDWEYFYDVGLTGYARGVQINGNTNAVLYDVKATGGGVGLRIDAVNSIGLAVTNCRFDGDETGVLGRFRGSCCQFNGCVLGGKAKTAALLEGDGKLSFQNCVFEGWSDAGAVAARGTVNLLGCDFRGKGTAARLGPAVARAHILGNTFAGTPGLDIKSEGDIQITHHDFGFARPSAEPIVLPPDPRPAADRLFSVLEHGAKPEEGFDNTKAFQAALDAAGKAGGGTAYVPAGNYGFSGTITVPTGVELRGTFDVPHHTVSGGSVLMTYAGRGEEKGTPFISLAAKSGARGFTVWYPEQNVTKVVPYPWAIWSTGPGCWVVDVSVGNAYQGADFGTHPSEGHLLRYLCGAPLRRGLWVSKGSGVTDSCHFNPHFWGRNHPSYPEPAGQPEGGKLTQAVWEYQQRNLDGFIFGRCPETIQVNNFLYSCLHGLHFTDDGGGSSGRVINHGSDRASHGVTLDAASEKGIELVNTEIASPGPAALLVTGGFTGKASIFNSLSWWGGRAGVLGGKGDILIQQWYYSVSQSMHVASGRVSLQNLHFVGGETHVAIEGTAEKVSLVGNSARTFGAFRFTPGPNVIGRANSLEPAGQGKAGRFETGFEKGQPLPGRNDNAHNKLDSEKLACRPTAGEGREGGAGLVMSGEDVKKRSFAYFTLFETDIRVTPATVLSYWMKPEDERSRRAGVDLYFTDGSNLRDSGAKDGEGRGLHPILPKGPAGKWTKIECALGEWHTGKTIKTIVVARDDRESTGTFNVIFDDIFVGAPEGTKVVGMPRAEPDGGTHSAPVTVRLACEPAAHAIRYTLDGSFPRKGSPVYDNPIRFEKPGLYEMRFEGVGANGKPATSMQSRLFDVR